MGSKIYVGGLPYSATESEIETLFGEHGTVESARVITDKYTDNLAVSVLSKCLLQVRRKRQLQRCTPQKWVAAP